MLLKPDSALPIVGRSEKCSADSSFGAECTITVPCRNPLHIKREAECSVGDGSRWTRPNCELGDVRELAPSQRVWISTAAMCYQRFYIENMAKNQFILIEAGLE